MYWGGILIRSGQKAGITGWYRRGGLFIARWTEVVRHHDGVALDARTLSIAKKMKGMVNKWIYFDETT
jgi:hypothetical protein